MSFMQDIFGRKPTVPQLPSLNLQTEASKAIAGNVANAPAAEALVSQANTFTQQQIQSMLEQAIPGYSSLVSGVTGDISSMVKGELPADVKAQVQASTAASAVAGGYGGSGMAGNLTARDLGLTSLNLMQSGISTAESWMQEMDTLFGPGMLNVSSMFVSPGQQAAFDVEERNAQFQRQWMQNQIAAMPDPVLSGINTQITNLVGAYLSKGGGGGNYAATYTANQAQDNVSSGGGGGGAGAEDPFAYSPY